MDILKQRGIPARVTHRREGTAVLILIQGAGDIASGIGWQLRRSGFPWP